MLNNHIKIWGLRKKILLSMVMLLLLLGLTMTLITRVILLRVLKKEFQDKGLSLSRSIAANSLVDVLTHNTSRLKVLLENEKKLDNDIAYAFILGSSGHILSHTFDKGFPIDLIDANKLKEGKDFTIQLLSTQMGLIYDIATPIYLENSILGQVRIGVMQNSIQQTIMAINLFFLGATLLIMVIGIFLAYKISFLITEPISKLVKATQSIQKGDFSAKIDIKTKDEIGLLAAAFNEMSLRLDEMVSQIKQLTLIKERNRIGLDLHDGCAQDLANIIKRLELCEKLFKIEPEKAFQELCALRENTRDVLNRTRQVIFDLKSPGEALDFNLCSILKNFVKDFQRQNGINVKLNSPAFLDNILPDKSKTILFIISESFANIRKHSAAKNVEISLCLENNQLIINIMDDGKGFDINEAELANSGYGKWGLVGMRQRAISLGGNFAVDSRPEKGTNICVTIPLEEEKRFEKCQIT